MLSKKLSSVEIVGLFEKMEQHPESTKEVCSVLVQKLSYIPCALVAKYKKYDNYQDLKQIAYLTFLQSILTFDYHKSCKLEAWSWQWVKKEVAKAALREKKYRAGYECLDFEEFEKEQCYFPEDNIISLQDQVIVLKALEHINEKSQMVIKKTFGIEEDTPVSLRVLANDMGMSHESVRKIRNKAISRLAIAYSKAS